ncbi:MAG: hypothetical protein A3E82_07065 [Gammaproteobacteria bacterium RIFCSPHIGHO2_12_FULL_38_11]|nr:MAG: hypothetical protein A3E82_07065 [Gammaproteobacteria bacterium RIFCSPHIGHO2_12_FULL_38_11]
MKSQNIHPILTRILPFIMTLVMLIVFILGLFIFTYVFIFALIVGTVLFIVGYIRMRFFKPKQQTKATVEVKTGRIIEHDDTNNK